jgi:hypothetical protein
MRSFVPAAVAIASTRAPASPSFVNCSVAASRIRRRVPSFWVSFYSLFAHSPATIKGQMEDRGIGYTRAEQFYLLAT